MNWVTKNFLNPIEDGYQYAINNRKIALYKKYFFFLLFVLVSLIALLSTLILSILSTLKLAKLWVFEASAAEGNEQLSQILDNYVYITNTISACVALISTISAFFAFKDGYLKNRTLYRKLDFEIYQFENEMGYYYKQIEINRRALFVDRVFLILDEASNINKINKLKEKND